MTRQDGGQVQGGARRRTGVVAAGLAVTLLLAACTGGGERMSGTVDDGAVTSKPPLVLPPEDAAVYVQRGVSTAGMRVRARVLVRAPAHLVAARITPAVGLVEALDEETSVLHTGADTLETVALHLGLLGTPFEVTEPPELVEHVRRLAEVYGAAVAPPGAPAHLT